LAGPGSSARTEHGRNATIAAAKALHANFILVSLLFPIDFRPPEWVFNPLCLESVASGLRLTDG
jgi:hypothetical protein